MFEEISSEVIIRLLCTEYVVDSIWMFIIRSSGFDAESVFFLSHFLRR